MRIPAVRKKFGLPDRIDQTVATAAVKAVDPLNVKPTKTTSWSLSKWWADMKEKRGRDQALKDSESVGKTDYDNFIRAGQGKLPKTFTYNPKLKAREGK